MLTPSVFRSAAWFSAGLTLGGFGVLLLIALVEPAPFEHLLRKDDHSDTGLIECLTVIALLPAIFLAAFALVAWHRRLPSRRIAIWLALWTLACVYFAGEEASWGQWDFGIETPNPIEKVNDQDEMNLHNMSSWLDQKPRAVVKLFIIFGGLLLPISMHLKTRRLGGVEAKLAGASNRRLDEHLSWIFAPSMCWTAAGIVLFQRVASWIDLPFFQRVGTSEFRELGIAWFLALYLMSYFLRLMAARRPG